MIDRYWIPHAEHGWVPATLTEGSASTESVSLKADAECGGELTVMPSKGLPLLSHVRPEQEAGVDDACNLPEVSEAALLHTVRVRYLKDLIYTRISRVLIALNPFRGLPIYSSQIMDQYMHAPDSMELPPHIFCISKDALQGLKDSSCNQAVLISGESGAGKTESAKLVLSFVTEAVRGGGTWNEEKVRQTNPVLEAFGNSMTVRNNNSSRFGKWLDLRFSGSLGLLGCSLTSYLLETTRVCSQASDERSFHVFFQLLQARTAPEFAELRLEEPRRYRYISEAQLLAPGIDDARCFEELCEGLAAVGFTAGERAEVFRIVAGVLTLGNCEFQDADDSDHAKLVDEAPSRRAAELLGVDCEILDRCMSTRKIVVVRETTIKPLNKGESQHARDALARLIYGRLFLWLIRRMNMALSSEQAAKSDEDSRLLGVLDIAGFESFKKNSLEQLMINLSNEHLQQQFNSNVFKQELSDCEAEGVPPPEDLGFVDNSDCLALIDGKGGVLDLLEEMLVLPKSTNALYTAKVQKQHAEHPRFIGSKFSNLNFGISHFAGNVTYDCDGWLEKSANRSPDDAPELLASSSCSVLQEMHKNMLEEECAADSKPGGRPAKKVKSITDGFRASLRALVAKISNAQCHYVRCVKPNTEKVPGRFVGKMVLEQLLLSGVLATVKIRQQGYAARVTHKHFVSNYQCILPKTRRRCELTPDTSAEELKSEMENIIDFMVGSVPELKGGSPHGWAVGTNKIFMKAATSSVFEEARRKVLQHLVTLIQTLHIGHRTRKEVIPKRQLREEMRAFLKRTRLEAGATCKGGKQDKSKRLSKRLSWIGECALEQLGSVAAAMDALVELSKLLERAEALAWRNVDVLACERAQRRLKAELETASQLDAMAKSKDGIEIEKVVARALSLGFKRTEALQALETRGQQLRTQQPIVNAMRASIADHAAAVAAAQGAGTSGVAVGESIEKLEEIMEVAEQVGLGRESDKWMEELGGAELAKQLAQLVDEWHEQERRAEEEREAAARAPLRRTKSICALSPAEQLQVLKDLHQAAQAYDAETLEALLRRAEESGLQELEPALDAADMGASSSDSEEKGDDVGSVSMDTARRVFDQLQSVDFLLGALETARKQAAGADPPVLALRRLENLSRQLQRMPGYEEEAAGANDTLQRGLIERSSRNRRRSVFDSRDPAELQLAVETFGELSNYSRLKPPRTWKGHSRTRFFDESEPREEKSAKHGSMFVHSKVCIAEALTRAPQGCDKEAYEAAALQNFRNILVCTGDRPAQECQRQASRDAVVELVRTDPSLSGEVYMQTLKQLCGKLQPRTLRLSWELLHCLLLQEPPRAEVAEFVRTFLREAGPKAPSPEAAAMARACLEVLDGRGKDTVAARQSQVDTLGDASAALEPKAKEVATIDDATAALLESKAREVSNRLSRAAEAVSIEVARLKERNRQLEAELAAKSKAEAEGTVPSPEVARIAAKAAGVAGRLGQAASKLSEKVARLAQKRKAANAEVEVEEREICRRLARGSIFEAVSAVAASEVSAAHVAELQRLAARSWWQAQHIHRLQAELAFSQANQLRAISKELAARALGKAVQLALCEEERLAPEPEEGGRQDLMELWALRAQFQRPALSELERKELEDLRSLRDSTKPVQEATTDPDTKLPTTSGVPDGVQVVSMADGSEDESRSEESEEEIDLSGFLEEDPRRENAASRIQAVHRGRKGRKLAKSLEEERARVSAELAKRDLGKVQQQEADSKVDTEPAATEAKGAMKEEEEEEEEVEEAEEEEEKEAVAVAAATAVVVKVAEEVKAKDESPQRGLASLEADLTPAGLDEPAATANAGDKAMGKGKGKSKVGPPPPPKRSASQEDASQQALSEAGTNADVKLKGKGKVGPPPKRTASSKALGPPAVEPAELDQAGKGAAQGKVKGKSKVLAKPPSQGGSVPLAEAPSKGKGKGKPGPPPPPKQVAMGKSPPPKAYDDSIPNGVEVSNALLGESPGSLPEASATPGKGKGKGKPGPPPPPKRMATAEALRQSKPEPTPMPEEETTAKPEVPVAQGKGKGKGKPGPPPPPKRTATGVTEPQSTPALEEAAAMPEVPVTQGKGKGKGKPGPPPPPKRMATREGPPPLPEEPKPDLVSLLQEEAVLMTKEVDFTGEQGAAAKVTPEDGAAGATAKSKGKGKGKPGPAPPPKRMATGERLAPTAEAMRSGQAPLPNHVATREPTGPAAVTEEMPEGFAVKEQSKGKGKGKPGPPPPPKRMATREAASPATAREELPPEPPVEEVIKSDSKGKGKGKPGPPPPPKRMATRETTSPATAKEELQPEPLAEEAVKAESKGKGKGKPGPPPPPKRMATREAAEAASPSTAKEEELQPEPPAAEEVAKVQSKGKGKGKPGPPPPPKRMAERAVSALETAEEEPPLQPPADAAVKAHSKGKGKGKPGPPPPPKRMATQEAAAALETAKEEVPLQPPEEAAVKAHSKGKGKGKPGPPPPPKRMATQEAAAALETAKEEPPLEPPEDVAIKAQSKGKGKGTPGPPPPPKRMATQERAPAALETAKEEAPLEPPADAAVGALSKGKGKGKPGPPPPPKRMATQERAAALEAAKEEAPLQPPEDAAVGAVSKGKGKGKPGPPPPPKRMATQERAAAALEAAKEEATLEQPEDAAVGALSKGKGKGKPGPPPPPKRMATQERAAAALEAAKEVQPLEPPEDAAVEALSKGKGKGKPGPPPPPKRMATQERAAAALEAAKEEPALEPPEDAAVAALSKGKGKGKPGPPPPPKRMATQERAAAALEAAKEEQALEPPEDAAVGALSKGKGKGKGKPGPPPPPKRMATQERAAAALEAAKEEPALEPREDAAVGALSKGKGKGKPGPPPPPKRMATQEASAPETAKEELSVELPNAEGLAEAAAKAESKGKGKGKPGPPPPSKRSATAELSAPEAAKAPEEAAAKAESKGKGKGKPGPPPPSKRSPTAELSAPEAAKAPEEAAPQTESKGKGKGKPGPPPPSKRSATAELSAPESVKSEEIAAETETMTKAKGKGKPGPPPPSKRTATAELSAPDAVKAPEEAAVETETKGKGKGKPGPPPPPKREATREALAQKAATKEQLEVPGEAAVEVNGKGKGKGKPGPPLSKGTATGKPPCALSVTIVGAQGLRDADWVAGTSDPYCVCEVPERPDSKFQTAMVAGTLEPAWNHVAVISDFRAGHSLRFTVFDRDALKADDLLGRAALSSSQCQQGFDGDLLLERSHSRTQAFLTVKVVSKENSCGDGAALPNAAAAPSPAPAAAARAPVAGVGAAAGAAPAGAGAPSPRPVAEANASAAGSVAPPPADTPPLVTPKLPTTAPAAAAAEAAAVSPAAAAVSPAAAAPAPAPAAARAAAPAPASAVVAAASTAAASTPAPATAPAAVPVAAAPAAASAVVAAASTAAASTAAASTAAPATAPAAVPVAAPAAAAVPPVTANGAAAPAAGRPQVAAKAAPHAAREAEEKALKESQRRAREEAEHKAKEQAKKDKEKESASGGWFSSWFGSSTPTKASAGASPQPRLSVDEWLKDGT